MQSMHVRPTSVEDREDRGNDWRDIVGNKDAQVTQAQENEKKMLREERRISGEKKRERKNHEGEKGRKKNEER